MVLAADGRPLALTWAYTPRELLVDGIVHGVGVAFAGIGTVVLLVLAALAGVGAGALAALTVYAAGLAAMLGTSAAYNLWPLGRVKWILRRFDHAAIYVLIAGTYTPLVALVGVGAAAWWLLAAIWGVALVGMALKLALPGRFDRLSIGLYLALGWSGVLAYEPVIAVLPPVPFALLAAGGLLYSVGVVFHVWRGLPFQNAIWHVFVLVAAMCHYGAVLASLPGAQA